MYVVVLAGGHDQISYAAVARLYCPHTRACLQLLPPSARMAQANAIELTAVCTECNHVLPVLSGFHTLACPTV